MKEALLKEVRYFTSRSSGPGGQHVNKTESKVELHWSLRESTALDEVQKAILCKSLGQRIKEEGVLILYCQETRSQLKNKEIVNERFVSLIERLLVPKKARIRTKPTRSSVEKRMSSKKKKSERKQSRRKPGMDD